MSIWTGMFLTVTPELVIIFASDFTESPFWTFQEEEIQELLNQLGAAVLLMFPICWNWEDQEGLKHMCLLEKSLWRAMVGEELD